MSIANGEAGSSVRAKLNSYQVDPVAGRWYAPVPMAHATGGTASGANTIRLAPFLIHTPTTISDLACRVTTLSSGGFVQLAIYASDATTKYPTGNALAVTGSLSTTTAVTVSGDITGSDVTLQPGLYWMASNVDNATVALQSMTVTAAWGSFLIGSTDLTKVSAATANMHLALQVAQTFGTWPDLTSASFTENSTSTVSTIVFYKAA